MGQKIVMRPRVTDYRYFKDLSNRRLRRATRLYSRITRGVLAQDRDGSKLKALIQKMQNVGLYSHKTAKSDIAFRFLHRAYDTDKDVYRTHGIQTFNEWMRRNGWRVYSYGGDGFVHGFYRCMPCLNTKTATCT